MLDPEGIDYANGGCFWDGNDIQVHGSRHPHYKWGYKFTAPNHDIFSLGNTPLKIQHGDKSDYTYILESTAAYGSTIFWKYTSEYISAQGATQCH